jgi:altronate dehydratase large subunit
VEKSGLFIMDSPGKEDEFLTGVSAAGANIIIFTTGGGAPQGFPIVPVVKVASNPEKIGVMREHVDIDAGSIIEGKKTISDLGHSIVSKIMEVASGQITAAENNQYDKSIGIYTLGPTL